MKHFNINKRYFNNNGVMLFQNCPLIYLIYFSSSGLFKGMIGKVI